MKAAASLYAPVPPPDVSGAERGYALALSSIRVFIAAGKFGAVLRASLEIARAARRLMKARAQASGIELKLNMLSTTKWRERVVSDLGGARKLAAWEAAILQAMTRGHDYAPTPKPASDIRGDVHALERAERNARAIEAAKACAHPLIYRDPYRVDQDGLFRLPPLVRGGARKDLRSALPLRLPVPLPCQNARRDYVCDARPATKFSGYFAPVMVWPCEVYAARDLEMEGQPPAKTKPSSAPIPERQGVPKSRDIICLKLEAVYKTACAPRQRVRAPP